MAIGKVLGVQPQKPEGYRRAGVTYVTEFMAVQMEVSSSPSEKIFNALRTLEAMW